MQSLPSVGIHYDTTAAASLSLTAINHMLLCGAPTPPLYAKLSVTASHKLAEDGTLTCDWLICKMLQTVTIYSLVFKFVNI